MRYRLARLASAYGRVLLLAAIGVPVGALIGVATTVFGRVLALVDGVREAHALALVPFLAAGGALVAWAYRRWGGKAARGMGLVFDVGHGEEDGVPLRLVPLTMASTWVSHLFGGSVGREGVAVQIGAAISDWMGRHLPLKEHGNDFLVCGMAAGFAGLFQTPLAACAFALEALVAGRLEYHALACSLTAAHTASATSAARGLPHASVPLDMGLALDVPTLCRLAALGVAFGLAGGLFAWGLGAAKRQASRVSSPTVRIVAGGAALSVLLLALWGGRYCGLGTNLAEMALAGGGEGIMPWDWLLKGLLTIATLSVGFQGGEVTPLFSIGASLGAVLAGLVGMPVPVVAALGYAAVFGAATNTLLAPVLIAGEIFGFANLPAFVVVCAVSYLFSLEASIYKQGRAGR